MVEKARLNGRLDDIEYTKATATDVELVKSMLKFERHSSEQIQGAVNDSSPSIP